MAGRRTNLALFVALVVAMGTGVAAFAVGTAVGRAVVVAHGMAGLAVVLLAPWKQQIVRRGLRRPHRAHRAGLALLALVAVTVAAGIAHAAGATPLVGITAMQLHVGAALLAVLPAAWHVVTRPVRPRPADLGRRATARAAGLTLAAGAAWWAADGLYRLRGVRRRFTGSHEWGTDAPERMPVTQWLADTVPAIDPGAWSVTIDVPGSAQRLSLRDLRALPAVRRRAVLDCTGGWYAAQTWSGVPLSALVAAAAGRRVVVTTSHTGYARAFPVEAVGDLLLALDVAGAPLSAGHGAPARLVAPARRGFWWVKWVSRISVDDVPPWVQPPFPVQ